VAQPEDAEARENALSDGRGLDLIIVPGLAFTLEGDRLGRGKGYYDTYLERHVTYTRERVTHTYIYILVPPPHAAARRIDSALR
jgi:5-formyltetrahydrofolate cyclo-ligase